MNMYSSSSSSSSSSDDGFFEQMFTSVKEWNQSIDERRKKEKAALHSLIPLISSTIERPISRQPRRYIHREREESHKILYKQYFAQKTTYTDKMFRRRFRMRRHVFLRIMEALRASDEYFHQKSDATGRDGLTIEQKCTAAIRMLAYGTGYDTVDEHLNVAESTAKECLLHFVEGVITQFRDNYMRRPNADDVAKLLREGEERGFPGMMGSIDCMHWTWKNCPRSWKGQFQGRNKTPTLVLEAVASRDLWIWHAFFGTPGSCNDINVLEFSSSPQYNRSSRNPIGDIGCSRPLVHDLCDDDDGEEDITLSSKQTRKSKNKTDKSQYSIAEDNALCSAYIEAGGDANIATDQKKGEFWAKIMRFFEDAQRANPNTIKKRNEESCRGRWRRINGLVCKWVGIYEEAKQRKKSGWNEENVLGDAREAWEKDNNGSKFTVEHCWDILKHYPKWQAPITVEDQGSSQGSKRSNSDTQTVEVRPMGPKRLKNKDKLNTSTQDQIDNVTNCIGDLNTFDVDRLELQKEMFDFYKERENKKEFDRERKWRFKLYNTLMGRSEMTTEQMELFARLHEEFENI